MKPNKIIPCEIPWEGCECRYDISDSSFCNENNIFCEGNTRVCTLNYTKTTELPGGICPAPNNINRNSDDPQCICRVERSFESWKLANCGVDGTGTKIRPITIKKIGGYKACKVIPEPNEQLLENTTGILNVGGYFQFNPEVDVVGGTFQTVQIENYVNNICPVNCLGDWSNWSACASTATCDGINSYRTGTRIRTYRVIRPASNEGTSCSIPNNTQQTDSTCQKTDCLVNCVGAWDNWSACAATCDGINTTAPRTGTRTRTYRVTRPVSNGGRTCPIADNTTETNSTCQKTDCPIDCSGDWDEWSDCVATSNCDGSNPYIINKKKRRYIVKTPASNGGASCSIENNTIETDPTNCSITPCVYERWVANNPINKVLGGNENGVNTYICRGNYAGGTHLGKIYENGSGCLIGSGGNVTSLSSFAYYDSNKKFTWSSDIADSTYRVLGAIDNYNNEKTNMYICRVNNDNNTILGKWEQSSIYTSPNICKYPFDNVQKESQTFEYLKYA
jgi:hypothetical protein